MIRHDFPTGTWLTGDTFEGMATLPDQSVDMILADLPYGTTACAWDSVLPFDRLWAEYWRIVRPNAAIVLTAAQPFTSALIMSQIRKFKYCWVWHKSRPSGFAQAKNMPMKNYEDVCVFSQGVTVHASQSLRRMPYNPQGVVRFSIPKKYEKKSYSDSSFSKRPSHGTYEQNEGNYPRQVLQVASESATVHPTQKPVALFDYLIRTYTDQDATVLDNTAGSGTTAVAAIRSGRRWVCIERDETYSNAALLRICSEY